MDQYPAHSPTVPNPPSSPPQFVDGKLAEDAFCIQCSYNLRGLSGDGACPECGTPIARSLQGNLLRFSSPDYLSKLHRGVFLILTAIIVQLVLGFVGFGIGLATAALNSNQSIVVVVSSLLGILVAGVLLYGWWLFSEPDPGFLGKENGRSARQIVRWSVIGAAVVTALNLPVQFGLAGGGTPTGLLAVLSMLVGALGLIVTAVKFFASMLYVRWLAPRLPNAAVEKRARTLMWLGPVLCTFGIILLGIGPLIALVLYWNLFDWIRKDLKQIRAALPQDSPA